MADSPTPAGFGKCAECAYRDTGTPEICGTCANSKMESLVKERCTVCDLPFVKGSDECKNPVCKWDDRYFDRNYSIAMRSGVLEQRISDYKYNGKTGWGVIFSRVLLGYLRSNRATFRSFDLIKASPSYTGAGAARTWDHTRLVLKNAEQLAPGEWPFDLNDPPAVMKIAPTPSMVDMKKWKARYENATGPLRNALKVPDAARTRGKKVLVFDDVFTDGQTLNEVARTLRLLGQAKRVCGITLARQPYRGN